MCYENFSRKQHNWRPEVKAVGSKRSYHARPSIGDTASKAVHNAFVHFSSRHFPIVGVICTTHRRPGLGMEPADDGQDWMKLVNLVTDLSSLSSRRWTRQMPSIIGSVRCGRGVHPFVDNSFLARAQCRSNAGRQRTEFFLLIDFWLDRLDRLDGTAKSMISSVQPYILSLDGLDRRDVGAPASGANASRSRAV